MKYPQSIKEHIDVEQYLRRRNILHLYEKAKTLLLSGGSSGLDFKIRKPTTDNIWSFRIIVNSLEFYDVGEFTYTVHDHINRRTKSTRFICNAL